MYEGDTLELKIDGSWTSSPAMNIEDGAIWLNLADGRINLKRDQKAGNEEELTKDYLMKYNTPKVAKVEDDDIINDHILKRIDEEPLPPPPPPPGMKDLEADLKLFNENHTPKMVN